MALYAFPVIGYPKKTIPLHHGVSPNAADLMMPQGTPIQAMVSGLIDQAYYDSTGGWSVYMIGDADTKSLHYYMAHMLDRPLVQAGQRVVAGTPLGYVGKTGNASQTDPHLHIGIGLSIKNGTGPEGGAGVPWTGNNANKYLQHILNTIGSGAVDAPPPVVTPPPVVPPPALDFQFGFKAVADELGTAVVGSPLEPEQGHSGGSYQTTTRGLMFYSKAANRPLFLPSANAAVAEPPPASPAPTVIKRPSPNHGGVRASTLGCTIHSTRGGTATPDLEFQATVNWFANPASQVSAHIVIHANGTVAECLDPAVTGWHDPSTNPTHLGVELCQARLGGPITDEQLRSLAWWLKRMSERFGFPLTRDRLPEHRETRSGIQAGKSDVGPPYSYQRLEAFL